VSVQKRLEGVESVVQWRALPKDLPPRTMVHGYLDLWNWDETLERTHHAVPQMTSPYDNRCSVGLPKALAGRDSHGR